jgi:hypothetical protein
VRESERESLTDRQTDRPTQTQTQTHTVPQPRRCSGLGRRKKESTVGWVWKGREWIIRYTHTHTHMYVITYV